MNRIAIGSLAAALALLPGPLAQPVSCQLPDEVSTFKQGPNLEVTRNNCTACHSADYILMQPPKKGKVFWTAEVNKMIKTQGADPGRRCEGNRRLSRQNILSGTARNAAPGCPRDLAAAIRRGVSQTPADPALRKGRPTMWTDQRSA